MHTHDHHHGHGHHHGPVAAVVSKAFIWGIVLNTAYVVVQATAGIVMNSMALLSDAGHNLSDVISLVLGLLAHRLAALKPTQSFTYGYKKTTILAALANAVFLLITVGIIAYGSIARLFHPEPVAGGDVALVATAGIIVNGVSALFFFRNKEHDMNVKGAYLHLMADALVSVGVVVAGVLIRYTHWYWLDSVTSLVILVVILASTWSLLMDSLRLSLDAVPTHIKSKEIEQLVAKMRGVKNMHHIHIWAMSTTENALTAHVVTDDGLSFDEKMKLVGDIKHELMHHGIQHATIELEAPGMPCDEDDC
jgi:cobalt-zinc-cadmium efflux system protein